MNASITRRDGHTGVYATLLVGGCVLAALTWVLLRSSADASRARTLPDPAPTPVAAIAPPELEEAPRAALPPPAAPASPPRPAAPSPAPTAAPPERPDVLSEEDREIRADERRMLQERWERQEPNPAAADAMHAAVKERLLARRLDGSALSDLDCKRTLCRFELSTRGAAGLTPVSEVHELIRAARDLGETWVLATEPSPGLWRVEVFAPTEDHTLTGPGIE